MAFPENFVWGAAAASYQIEGAYNEEGKGLSVWDMLSHRPNSVYNGDTGDVACNHYHLYKDDVKLMRELGLQAYRLSISWPRVLPQGVGQVNEAGLAFYDALIDELLANNIQPYVTLFHWDFPLALYHRGGWLNRDSADWFAEYTDVMVRALGDRVKNWITINEPAVFTVLGHLQGIHAPGDRLGMPEGLRIAHHVLLANGKATPIIRDSGGKTGIASNGNIGIPATDSEQDIAAARDYMFDTTNLTLWQQNWWCDPVMFGHYPEEGITRFGHLMPDGYEQDLPIIHQKFDFFGLNTYWGDVIRAGDGGQPEHPDKPIGHPLTMFHWHVTPDALYWGPRFLYERYGLPIIITENGLSNPDWVHRDGKVHDPQRIDYTARYLSAFSRAHDDGVAIGGYFHWSILDNFEWAEGMKHRFGLVYVDYATQQRIPKDSAYWYRDVIQSNGATL